MKNERMRGHSGGTSHHHRRGIALLLVMVSLVVCSILTAGFLSSQGTAIGIARNERDAEKARGIAQSGIDLCCWQIKNRSDWRTAMSPGAWLTNYAIGDGTVTVTAATSDGTSSFANDTTAAAVLTSVGTYNNRTFTLTATMGPTGGGTVFRGGNYMVGRIIMGTDNGNGSAVIDSYNSALGSYALTHGSNAVFGNNYTGVGALTVYASSDYSGSFVAATAANISNAVYSTWWFNAPSSTSQATQVFVPGNVITPNTAALTYIGTISHGNGTFPLATPGTYDAITLNGTLASPTTNITASGIYHITGNVSMSNAGVLNVATGVNAVIIVDGNVTMGNTSKITLTGTGTLTMYVAGSFTMTSSSQINFASSTGNTAAFTLMGTPNNATISMATSATIVGSVYAPSAAVTMSNSSVIYGAMTAKSLWMPAVAAFHYDTALTSKQINNLTKGSAPAGTANYVMNVVGASNVVSHN